MRLSGKEVILRVVAVPQVPERPVRIRGGGFAFNMNVDEAIDLANQLVDTVETINAQERNQQ